MINPDFIPSDKKGAEIHVKAIKQQMIDMLQSMSRNELTSKCTSGYAWSVIDEADKLLGCE